MRGTVTHRHEQFQRVIGELLEFYRSPLCRALNLLADSGYSYQKIANIVFQGEVSKQAVYRLAKEAKKPREEKK